MEENKIKIEITEQEASYFVAMREAKVFDLKNTDFIMHVNFDGVLTDIRKPIIKEKNSFVFIYKRKKALDK